ncbi:MAG TPA: hypothetical protein VMZ53_19540 [Kofleriaceae bacterium]|nr:hypothetical protein [Kofleriaceae bacterium]
MTKLDNQSLETVTGGVAVLPIQPPGPRLPNGQAPPKYSAPWWDAVRSSRIGK